jgi:hypothetical protein
MSDTAQVVTTETSAATTPAPAPMDLRDLSDSQRTEWLKTGDLPDAAPVAEAPATESTVPANSDDVGENHAAVAAPVETPQKPPKPRNDINARLGQLAEQRRVEADRADRAEARARDLESRLAGAAQPDVDGRAAIPVSHPPVYEELAVIQRYQSEPGYPSDIAPFIEANFADPYAAQVAAQNIYINRRQQDDQRRADATATLRQQVEARVDQVWADGPKKYADWDLSPLRDLQGPSAPVFAELAFSSDLSVDLLYHFSKHPAEARALAAMEPTAAAHALGKLEHQLSTSAPSRVATPTKTLSDAPEPPQTLGVRHTPNAGDEVDAAVREGDTGRYIEAENKREYARMKAGQR